eukprot:3941176-Rhodomonas_salina.3
MCSKNNPQTPESETCSSAPRKPAPVLLQPGILRCGSRYGLQGVATSRLSLPRTLAPRANVRTTEPARFNEVQLIILKTTIIPG